MQNNYWKNLSLRLFFAIRMLFLVHISIDLFLATVIHSSQRAYVLTGIGLPFAPYIVSVWLFIVIGLLIILPFTLNIDSEKQVNNSGKFAHPLLILSSILYLILSILSVINPFVSWPIIFSFFITFIWSCILIYFRYKFRT